MSAGGLVERRGREISGIVVLSLRTTEHREDRDEPDSPLELYSYAELRPLPAAVLRKTQMRHWHWRDIPK